MFTLAVRSRQIWYSSSPFLTTKGGAKPLNRLRRQPDDMTFPRCNGSSAGEEGLAAYIHRPQYASPLERDRDHLSLSLLRRIITVFSHTTRGCMYNMIVQGVTIPGRSPGHNSPSRSGFCVDFDTKFSRLCAKVGGIDLDPTG